MVAAQARSRRTHGRTGWMPSRFKDTTSKCFLFATTLAKISLVR